MRLACFHIPLFPLAARLRAEPELLSAAVVITEGSGSAAHVVAASRRARKSGIRAGMSLPQARAILPRLIARSRDEVCERSAHEALLEVAESFSPRVEDGGEGVAYFDLAGLERIWGQRGTRNAECGSDEEAGSDDGLRIEMRNEDQVAESAPSYSPLTSGPPSPEPRTPNPDPQSAIRNPQSTVADRRPPSTPLLPHSASRISRSHESRLASAALLAMERASLPGRIGIASSKLAARIAAELPDTPVIVPDGGERAFLAPLPLHRLCPAMEIAAMLGKLGISSIGAFARLPEGEIATRFGEEGRELHYAARGIDISPLIPHQPPPVFEEGMDLEWPLVELEPFLFIANAALDRLTERLASRGYACRILDLTLRLEPEGFDTRSIALPAPTRDVKTLLTLTKLDIEKRPPGAPVAALLFTAHPDKPRRGQLSLFGPAEISPDRLMATVARIGSIVGPNRVGSPRAVDDHRPESIAIVAFDPPPPPRVRQKPKRGRGLLVVRTIRPPIPLDVEVDHEPPPGAIPTSRTRLRSIRAREDTTMPNGRKLSIEGPVRVASGPWTLEDGWWSESPAARDYWDVEIAGGTYRLFRERESGEWYVDAGYD
jgi:protein ImuB